MMKSAIIPIAILAFVCLLCDFYIAQRIVKPRFGKRGISLYAGFHLLLIGIFTALGILAAVGMMTPHIPLLIWVLITFFFLYIPKLLYSVFSLIDYLRRPRGRVGGIIGMTAAGISLLLLIAALINNRLLEVKEVTVESERLPASFDGYRVVQISDMHLETLFSRSFVERVVETINEQHPDVVLFTGDLVNRLATEIENYSDLLSQIEARDGVYSVMGNHDYGDYVKWDSPADREANLCHLHDLVSAMDWQLLDNTSRYIYRDNDSIAVIGVENWGEPPFPQYGKLHEAYPNLQDDTYKILLTHNPRHWRAEVLPKSNIDLTLSGHTHAMQMVVFGHSPSSRIYPEWGGLYREGDRQLYVNIGIGCAGIPLRLGATPEITLITLHTAQ